jgi:hypothetical protein
MSTPAKMTVSALREALASRGLDSAGLKPALATRLQEAMDGEAGGGGGQDAAGEQDAYTERDGEREQERWRGENERRS